MTSKKTCSKRGVDTLIFTADEVVALRTTNSLNQTVFWSRVGVTQSCGSRYESGRKIPLPVQKLLAIAYGSRKLSARTVESLTRPWRV